MDLKQTGWVGIVWINLPLNIGTKYSGSAKCGKIIDQARSHWVFKKDSVP
jgi:hypothetical protein